MKKRSLLFVLFFVFIPALSACGKKAPPVADCRQDTFEITDLNYRITDLKLVLTWNIKATGTVSELGDISFIIQRSKLGDSDCRKCPYHFVTIGEVPAAGDPTKTDRRKGFVFNDQLEAGFRYVYQVIGISEKESMRVISKPVIYDCPRIK